MERLFEVMAPVELSSRSWSLTYGFRFNQADIGKAQVCFQPATSQYMYYSSQCVPQGHLVCPGVLRPGIQNPITTFGPMAAYFPSTVGFGTLQLA